MTRKSKGIGTILQLFLWVGLCVGILSTVVNIIWGINEELFLNYLYKIDIFFSIFFAALYVMTLVIYLIWIYRIHADLAQLDSNYTISPGAALARIMIPFYSIWGTYNTYSTMAKYFQNRDTDETLGQGNTLYSSIPFLYVTLFISNLFGRLIMNDEYITPTVYVLSYIADSLMLTVFIIMTTNINNAMETLTTYKSTSEELDQTDNEEITTTV